jgi:hypothetical protein
VEREQVDRMGEKWEMAVVETSAKNNRDVDRVF